jgi:starch-binding outer membrane protein SusE/F
MKNISKLLIALIGVITISCSTTDVQDRPVIKGIDAPSLTAPLSGASYTLLLANLSQQADRFTWTSANYGGSVTINYTLEMDTNTGTFANPQILGTANSANQLAVTVATLNNACTVLGATPFVSSNFKIRVKSTASGYAPMYSNVKTIAINPFSTALPKLGVPGNHQGWTPTDTATLPLLAASFFGKTNFEGYASLNGEFKFLNPKPNGTFAWGGDADDWADDGTFSGTLVNLGGSNCTAATGYYLIKANTGVTSTTNPGGLSYSTTLITTWGVIGDATANGWGASTAMTYSATTKKWSITLPLTGGKQFKFRANNDWGINLGKFDASKTGNAFGGDDMSYDGINIDVATSGTYTITLDLSNPRAYKYTIN